MATGMVTLPMDAFFQPLFFTFEGLLDDIRDRLEFPNKLFGTWGSKKGPAATDCMKGLGHLKIALEIRPILYTADRWAVFDEQMKMKPTFDATATSLLTMLNSVADIATPTLVGDSPSVQVYFVRNVLAFLTAMKSFPACHVERVANFFANSPAKIAEYQAALQSYLDSYNKRYGRLAASYAANRTATRTVLANILKAAATETSKTMPLPPGFAFAATNSTSATLSAKNQAAAFARYGTGIGKGGRRHTKRHRNRKRKTRRHQ